MRHNSINWHDVVFSSGAGGVYELRFIKNQWDGLCFTRLSGTLRQIRRHFWCLVYVGRDRQLEGSRKV